MYNNTRAYVQMSYAKNMSLYTKIQGKSNDFFCDYFSELIPKNIIRKNPSNKDI